MVEQILDKIKESAISVLPVSIIVIILHLTSITPLESNELIAFIISSVLLILGISLFNLGADIAMQPMGEHIGSSLIKTNKIPLILFVCFIMGLLITIAEPDLTVLANQVKNAIEPLHLIISIGVAVGVFLVLGIIKMFFNNRRS